MEKNGNIWKLVVYRAEFWGHYREAINHSSLSLKSKYRIIRYLGFGQ